jgi:dihydrofolate reductase
MIALIAAVARSGAIGRQQQLLWQLPEDMKHFRETTRDKTVIMGRKTWESLPAAFRPLPKRHNIVVSRNPAYFASGATRAGSIEEAIRLAGDASEIFVIGGAEPLSADSGAGQSAVLDRSRRGLSGRQLLPGRSA